MKSKYHYLTYPLLLYQKTMAHDHFKISINTFKKKIHSANTLLFNIFTALVPKTMAHDHFKISINTPRMEFIKKGQF